MIFMLWKNPEFLIFNYTIKKKYIYVYIYIYIQTIYVYIYIVIHRQIFFVLSEFISVARQ